MFSKNFAQMKFPEAAEQWLASRNKINGGEHSTRFMYTCYIKALTRFFADKRLDHITSEDLQEYQKLRAAGSLPGSSRPAGPSLINHELNTLQQMMKRAGLWAGNVSDWYERLAVSQRGPGVALGIEEEDCLFRTASRKKRWLVAYCCSLITANTTAGPGEIRHLRLRDVELKEGLIHIEEAIKTEGRRRTVPLNSHARWAMGILVELARKKGCYLPEHYLLPHRAHVKGAGWDPLNPMGGWRTAWEALRAEAGRFYPKLAKLRMYDLRHHAITRLLENPEISEGTVREICGHVSLKMLARYSHCRIEVRRKAVDAMVAVGKFRPDGAPTHEAAEHDSEVPIAVGEKGRYLPPVFRSPLLLKTTNSSANTTGGAD
jgi:integrase